MTDEDKLDLTEWVIGFLRPEIMKIERSGAEIMVAVRRMNVTSSIIHNIGEKLTGLENRIEELENKERIRILESR